MEIKKIVLLDGGFKGMKVWYKDPNERNSRMKNDTVGRKIEHPIHLGLEKPFKDLRFHLLEICEILNGDMDKKDVDQAIAEAEMIGVTIDGNGFVLSGTKEVLEGKEFKLETPSIGEEDGYEHYESVAILIGLILEETKVYIRGEAKVTDEEVVERWIKADKQKGFDINSFNALSAEEKKEMCQEILEKSFGCVVLGGDDFTTEIISTEEVTADFKQELDPEQDVIEINLNVPEPIILKK